MIQSQKKTLYNDRFIKYGKYVILIFVISLLTLATFLFQKTNQIKHRDLILNNTIELIGEEIDFSKSVIFFSEDHQLDSQALTKHTLNIQKLLTEIQSHDHDTPQINNALFKLEQTVNSLKEFMSEFNLLFRQISQSRIQFQRELEQCQDHLSTSTQRNALSDLIHANQLSLLAIKTDTIDHFENTTNRFENTVTIDACKPLIFQSRQLIDLQQRLSGVYHQIIDLPLKENILSVHALYQTETNNDVKLSFWYNLTLVIISLLFLTFISLSLYRLFHVNKNLVITLEDLEQQKNIYHALSEANHAASALATKEEIYQTITDIIIRYIRIPSCWVAVKQLNSNWVNPVAMSGIGQEVLSNIQVSVDPNIPEGQGAVGIAYRTKKAVIQNDYSLTESSRPWFSEAMKWGIHSLAAFPIMRGKDVEAIIVFYALKPNFFNKKVVKIIQELIDEVSLALERLRFREAEQAHQTSQNISAIAFESQESIIITDKDAKILKTNQAFTEMTGYTESEVFGRRPDMLRSSKHPLSFYDDIWKTVTKTGRWNGETWSRRKDGTEYQVYQTITAVFDDNQKITNYILHRIDITQSKQAESEISYLKNHDDLTGLANRSFLKQKIEQFLLQEQQANVSFNVILVIVNIKRFKTLNETLGHLAGDEILIETANRLKNIQLKDSINTSISRIGSDEFTILCQLNNSKTVSLNQQVNHIMNAINQRFELPFQLANEQVNIQISLGVTLFDTQSQNTPEEIIQQALTALNRARKNDQNNFEFYQREMQERAIQERNLEIDLARALEKEEFVLYYQPQIELKTGRVIGAEVLVRWQKEDGSLIPPLEFIPTLESSNLIIPLGHWLIQQALSDVQPFQEQFKEPLLIAVNLSALQFKDPNLADFIQDTIKRNNCHPECLELEVTESILMENHTAVTEILEKLSKNGTKIAIDDFGTGYSSLAYIKHFPVNKLKIDKSFIDDIEKPKDLAIVRSIIEMANAMNIRSIAEGVETITQKEMLEQLNCQEVQGFYYSQPLPFNDFIEYALNNQECTLS
ncbi:bifunctional diguanylate cyclase/phosphodiesterase [Hydrogenovibrio marinus]|uniref:bifunctional diguanylate cyclase/phosphodiesterase n=3 Tax=Hydrogenovibrio marinus TaxID=28885 RepID=UPI0004A6B288|nr:EAL domain-containing protein [Hydrogenovibrio marinus]BBN60334.1 hypothetical protein HVMH_1928 [Hydrogenovibrio marinus]